MTWLDYAVIGVVLLSVAWGIWRGLVREIMSLAGWVIAFLAANLFAGPLSEFFPPSWRPELRLLLAFAAIFVGSLVVTTLVGLMLSKIAAAAGLGGLDRSLGGLFGLARAALVVVAFALVAGLTPMPGWPEWKGSLSGPWLMHVALAAKTWLPPTFAERLRYD